MNSTSRLQENPQNQPPNSPFLPFNLLQPLEIDIISLNCVSSPFSTFFMTFAPISIADKMSLKDPFSGDNTQPLQGGKTIMDWKLCVAIFVILLRPFLLFLWFWLEWKEQKWKDQSRAGAVSINFFFISSCIASRLKCFGIYSEIRVEKSLRGIQLMTYEFWSWFWIELVKKLVHCFKKQKLLNFVKTLILKFHKNP